MSQTKKPILLALGKLIQRKRKARQLSQEQLGFLSNLDRTYISGVERGIRNPSLTAIVSLASGLDITVSELLENLETEAANLSNE
jgi:transcriptional regulator with XRE-family HTH domain